MVWGRAPAVPVQDQHELPKSNHRYACPRRRVVSPIALGVHDAARSGANTNRNEVGNLQPPLLGRIHPALTSGDRVAPKL